MHRRHLAISLAALAAFSFFASPLSAAVVYVDASAVGAADGSSWADAYTEVSIALGAAVSGDSLWVAAGTYRPTATTDRTAYFGLVNDVALFGGFTGVESALSERDFRANETILSGDIGVAADSTDNSHHVVVSFNNTSTAVIDGFTIRDALMEAGSSFTAGAGIAVNNSSAVFRNLIVRDNHNRRGTNGGGIGILIGSPTFTGCRVFDNGVNSLGGGLYASLGSANAPLVANSEFYDNDAAGTAGGGIILIGTSSNPLLTNVSVSGNSAVNEGGGIYIAANATVTNVISWGNTASSDDDYRVAAGTVTTAHSLIGGSGGSGAWNPAYGTDGGNNLDVDPLFIDEAGGDLRLQVLSPAIDAGDSTATGVPTEDLDGIDRVVGPEIDMGAYEWRYCGPVWYVDGTATGNDNGSSWGDAFTTLGAALAQADACGSGGEIWVAAGTYYPTTTTDRSISFDLVNGVAVYGGFTGTETMLSQRDFRLNETILSGDIGVPADSTDNSFHVVTSEDNPSTTVLDGFTVEKALADDPLENDGAGIELRFSSAVLRNLLVRDCVSDASISGNGGGLSAFQGGPTIENCRFVNNEGRLGGGAYLSLTLLEVATISGCSFEGNSGVRGGGLHLVGTSASPIVTNVTAAGNTAAIDGGGLYSASNATLTNAIAWGNTAPTGADLHFSAGTLTTSYSLIGGSGGSGAWDPAYGTDGGNNLDVDPLFVDEAGGDFRLALSSPAIDAGDSTATSIPATDLDGNDRIVGAEIDMGAYERGYTCGSVIYVDASATGGSDGSSWLDAFVDLQDGLGLATLCGGEVWVAAGTYYPTTTTDRSISFDLVDGVAVYGGFTGTETMLSQRDFRLNETILSGDIGVPADSTDNSFHVVTSEDNPSTTVLDGFTVEKGLANDPLEHDGAGLELRTSSPVLRNLLVRDCVSDVNISGNGGGLFAFQGGPTIENCRFVNNEGRLGGGAYLSLTLLEVATISGCSFEGNSGVRGGGLHLVGTSASPIVTNVTAAGNTAAIDGGGLYSASNVTLTNAIAWGNTAPTGADLHLSAGTLTTSHSLIGGSGGSGAWDPAYGTDGGNNLDVDPLFADEVGGDYRLSLGSPAIDAGDDTATPLAATDLDGNDRILGAAIDMGAYEFDGGLEITSIVDVANDQGRRVRLTFDRAFFDVSGGTPAIEEYVLFRRIDPLPGERAAAEWDIVASIPALGLASYNSVVETLTDSTIAEGQHWSVFQVRATTADVGVFLSSAPDSGYSLDNLSPAPPGNFRNAGNGFLAWDEVPDADFDYFTVYGSNSNELDGTATVVGQTSGLTMGIAGNVFPYYFVTATDFSGNEGDEAALDATTGVSPVGAPLRVEVRANPNPFNPVTTIHYAVDRAGDVSLRLYDVNGRLMETLVDGVHLEANRYELRYQPRFASGVYFLQLDVAGERTMEKLVLLK